VALGALAEGTLPELVGSLDPATGQRLIDVLQTSGGNAAVQRAMDPDMMGARYGDKPDWPPPPSATAKPAPPPGPEAQKSIIEQIKEIHSNIWVGPLDELKLGRLWSSFGSALPQVYDANVGLWNESRDRGMDLTDIGILNLARGELGSEVRGIALEYLAKNMTDATNAEKELGFDQAADQPPSADVVERRQDVAWAAVQLQELRKVKGRLEMQYTGFVELPDRTDREGNNFGGLWPTRFSPGRPPDIAWNDPRGASANVQQQMVPYEEVNTHWKAVTGALLALADEHPVLFTALREDKLGQVSGEDPTDDPVGSMRTILTTMKASIRETQDNITSGSLDWQKLKPIHRQLLEGERKGKHPWNHPVYKAAAKELVGDYETASTVADIGIGLAAAVMFLFASAATGGAAALFLLGGLGLGAANAAAKWKNYDELKDAAQSAASSKTELVGKDQVDSALLDAILESAFFALDAWQAGKAGVKLAAGAVAKRAGAKAAAVEGVEELAKQLAKGAAPDAAGRALVERSIVEQGVETTMKRMGISDPVKLAAHVPVGSAAAARIAEYASVVVKLGKDVDVPKVLRNLAKEATQRELGELDGIVRLAIERYGPLATLQMAGGWKKLASALGADSGAGKLLLAWRDSIYRDLKAFVEGDLKASVKETGTIGNFTNDLDMSFLGKDAAAQRSKGLQFLAGRAGLPANAGLLDSMLYIGLFTDPRRLHLFDKFPDLAADLSKKTAGFEEQLIWNAELQRVSKNAARRQRVLDAMGELGIKEIPEFKPLSERAADVLSAQQDRLVGEIEQLAAKEPPDKGALANKMLELAETQAQINVKEGGGYFSSGGVRRFVTEDPKSPFPGYGKGEAPGKPTSMEYTAALDQVNKLRDASEKLASAALKGPEGLADVAGSIKSIAKYGDRFVEAAKAVGLKLPDPAVFDAMAAEFQRILQIARRETGETLQVTLKQDYDKLMGEVGAAVGQFDQVHIAVLKDLRTQAGIVGREVVAADVVKATVARYRWTVFKSILLQEAGSLGRLISEGLDVPEKPAGTDGTAPTGAVAPPTAPRP
jgi:hypothetical protein